MTVIYILAAIFVALFMFLVWGLCAAAKRGDEMDELAQFSHRWVERP